MGRPKALLELPGGSTFVRQLCSTLFEGGIADVLVVGRPDDADLRREVETAGGRVSFVTNPHAERGQLSSVVAGLNAADRPGTTGILIAPVDLPLVTAATVSSLLHVFRSAAAPIVRATHGGRHGHPVIFGRPVFEALRHADASVGAASVIRSGRFAVHDLEVDDPGVLRDIDTPEDYSTLRVPDRGLQ